MSDRSFGAVHRQNVRLLHRGGKSQTFVIVTKLGEFATQKEAEEAVRGNPAISDPKAVVCSWLDAHRIQSMKAAEWRLPVQHK